MTAHNKKIYKNLGDNLNLMTKSEARFWKR